MLAHLLRDEKIIAVVGLAKNTGKTVTLNHLLAELNADGRGYGVTSIGRDGEAFDALDRRLPKPPIYLPAGCLVSGARPLLAKGEARLEILETTGYSTPVGRVVIGRVIQAGRLEIAGAGTARQMKATCQRMLRLGAELAVVDGAMNRKAVASPQISDGVIVATGAVLSAYLDEVVEITRYCVDLLRLPEVGDANSAENCIRKAALGEERISLLDCSGERLACFDSFSELEAERSLPTDVTYIIVRRSLMASGIERLLRWRAGKPLTVVVEDGTRIFAPSQSWRRALQQGFTFRALHKINLLAVTVNPVAPGARRFPAREFLSVMQQALPGVAVLDVMNEDLIRLSSE